MALTIKPLGEGQLPSTKTALYTVPASTQAIVINIILVNETTGDLTANLYANLSGTSRRLTPVNLVIPAGQKFTMKDKVTLAAADIIEGDASAATDIDYVINGVENA